MSQAIQTGLANIVRNKTIIGLKYWNAPFDKNKGDVRNKTIIGLKSFCNVYYNPFRVRNKTIIGLKYNLDSFNKTDKC